MIPSVIGLVLLFIIRCRFPANRSFAAIITQRYGKPTLDTYRRLEKTEYRYKKCRVDLEFLHTCQDHNLIPKFLNFRLYNERLKTTQLYRDFQRKLLAQEIGLKEKRLASLTKLCDTLHSQLKSTTWISTILGTT